MGVLRGTIGMCLDNSFIISHAFSQLFRWLVLDGLLLCELSSPNFDLHELWSLLGLILSVGLEKVVC